MLGQTAWITWILAAFGNGLAAAQQISRIYTPQNIGSCKFDRVDPWCNFRQGTEDEFDWEMDETDPASGFVFVDTNVHEQGQQARLFTPSIDYKDTHCVSFDFKITGHGELSVYVIRDFFVYSQPVWSSQSITTDWTTVQLALSPQSYKLVFEGRILSRSNGIIALDNIDVQYQSCRSAPHFLRLGDTEVNEGQSAELQCIANGDASWGQNIRLQKFSSGMEEKIFRSHNMVNFQSAKFIWPAIGTADADKIRCVASNATAAGVSNYAELKVRRPPVPIGAPEVDSAGPTHLIVRLNVDPKDPETYIGDGPVTNIEFRYKKVESAWEDGHDVPLATYNGTYRIWHLEPDTLYMLCVVLERPGPGGTGKPGPCLEIRTKCAKPMPLTQITVSPYKGQVVSETAQGNYADNLLVRWAKPTPRHAGCRTWGYVLKWRQVGGFWKTQEPESNRTIISNLRADTPYEVQVSIRNMVGTTDSLVIPTKTNDGLPEPIPSFKIKVITTEESIIVQWPHPAVPNGDILAFKLGYAFFDAFDGPRDFHPGPPFQGEFQIPASRNVYEIANLPPGTTYNLTLSAKTSAGFGRPSEFVGTTKIGSPKWTGAYDAREFSTNEDIVVTLRGADGNGAPVSHYNVVVENAENNTRRRRKRSLSSKNGCFDRSIDYETYLKTGAEYYFAAEIDQRYFEERQMEIPFRVGDNNTYNGFRNAPLPPGKKVSIWVQAVSIQPGCNYSRGQHCDRNVKCQVVATRGVKPPPPPVEDMNNSNSERIYTDKTATKDGETLATTSIMLYGGVSVALLLLLFIFVGSVVCFRRRALAMGPERYRVQSPVDFGNRTDGMYSDHSDIKKPPSSYPTEKTPLMPDLVDYPSSSRKSEAEDFAVRVEDFPIHVSQMRSSRTYSFADEFETLPEGNTASWDVAQKPENIQKNRYTNILPYDHSRVVLRSNTQIANSGDYINASWISGYGLRYIAAQGPTETTIPDFWHCIWQENIRLLIMVTGLVEVGRRKCHQYWPNEIRGIERYGNFSVELISEQVLAHYTLREFKICLGGLEPRIIRQMQFQSWPDHGVPTRPTGLLHFVRRSAQLNPDYHPVLVHCSAGSGRSGCFIVLDWMLRMADSEGLLDIYNTVKELRNKRVNMVANLEQYIFLHDSLLEAVLCGETGVQAMDLSSHYDNLITVTGGGAPIQEEFETLAVLTPRLTTEECQTARLARNRVKNRFQDVLPADRDLPYLITPDPAGSDPSHNYINAVFADSFLVKRDLIITQMPLPHTVGDFWRLVHDYSVSVVVMLNDASETDETCANYWPAEQTKETYSAFTVESLDKSDEIELVSRTLKLTNYYRSNDPAKEVKLLQLSNWPAGQPVPSSRNAVLRLVSLIDQHRSTLPPGSRVLLHCVAGAGKSGTFASCYNVIQQLKSLQTADVFSSVLQLRAVRPQLVETLEQYRFIYEVAMEYADCEAI
ncbi:Oidioi.mRNA.OKI2018_I69.PAR.g9482.t1.cds [Oikopleura dioica]|uniref:protein-tyrosine-phosphatase n=1 Tax=Oikopleura dioica TaxID=34765 RepID=A0ABN7RKW6_OIKDI|nr:Oidioi.mRNA.OKI2018_I69.PAR.g9482.t1.cds [Oikopleura dioica]